MARLTVQSLDGARTSSLSLGFHYGAVEILESRMASEGPAPAVAFARVLEARVPLHSAGIAAGEGLRFQCSLWQEGLPVDAVPQSGWLELRTTNPAEIGR